MAPSIVRRAAIARGHDPEALERRRQIAREQRQIAAEFKEQPVRDFAQQVALATAGPCLRYSQRLQLLDLARRDGIARFDANLIIAAIEHQSIRQRTKVQPTTFTIKPISSRTVLLTTALAVQLAIVLSAWIALH